MKKNIPILTLLVLYCLTTSMQCENCTTKPLLIGKEKSWLPAIGDRELRFTDNINNPHVFRVKAIDKTELVANECDENYQAQYINTTLYLNQDRTDSIFFALRPSNWLCLNAYSNGQPNIIMCDIFAKSGQGKTAKRL